VRLFWFILLGIELTQTAHRLGFATNYLFSIGCILPGHVDLRGIRNRLSEVHALIGSVSPAAPIAPKFASMLLKIDSILEAGVPVAQPAQVMDGDSLRLLDDLLGRSPSTFWTNVVPGVPMA
jgi:hypothetical protein